MKDIGITDMMEKLRQYYEMVGISSTNFRCSHFEDCKSNTVDFVQAKAALIGKGYPSHVLPRVLLVSLDPGKSKSDVKPENRTVRGVQETYEKSSPLKGAKQRHWYRTHEIAYTILGAFDPAMTIEKVKGCFAHTNCCKCCANKPHRRQADRRLFTNCIEYMPDEVSILNPDIIVTQGNEAARSITNFVKLEPRQFLSTKNWNSSQYPEIGVLVINSMPVLWIHTYHPSCWGRFNKISRPRMVDYSRIAVEFMTNSRQQSDWRNTPTR